jgi:hypothetical protein
VNEHVSPAHQPPNITLKLVRQLVRPLERGARAELHVQVDVPAAAGAPRAQLVKARNLRCRVTVDRAPDRLELVGRERLVHEHP